MLFEDQRTNVSSSLYEHEIKYSMRGQEKTLSENIRDHPAKRLG
jgi:hypothetical protein